MKRHRSRGTRGENDFEGSFKTSLLMRSSMETSVFGGVALCMPAWIRVKDKSIGADENKNYNSSLLVRTSNQEVVCGCTAFSERPKHLFFSLFLEQMLCFCSL